MADVRVKFERSATITLDESEIEAIYEDIKTFDMEGGVMSPDHGRTFATEYPALNTLLDDLYSAFTE